VRYGEKLDCLNSNLQWWNFTLIATASKSGAVRSTSLYFCDV
jgi:hypothetical protein